MINKNKFIKKNQGQIAIFVLLASAVLLTLGLSAARKTITDTKISSDEELLKEAFNTAESGINNYLSSGASSYSNASGTVSNIESRPIGNGSSLSSEGKVLANTNQLFWLVNHKNNGDVGSTYYNSGSVNLVVDSAFINGALKVDYFYIDAGVYKVQRFGCRYDSNSNSAFNNGFDDSCSVLTLSGNPLLIVVTPIGAATGISISGSSNFPLQGEELTAVGITDNNIKTQIKTRHVYQLPTFFLDSITARNIIQ